MALRHHFGAGFRRAVHRIMLDFVREWMMVISLDGRGEVVFRTVLEENSEEALAAALPENPGSRSLTLQEAEIALKEDRNEGGAMAQVLAVIKRMVAGGSPVRPLLVGQLPQEPRHLGSPGTPHDILITPRDRPTVNQEDPRRSR